MSDYFLRIKEVIKRTQRARATIYNDIRRGEFPAPARIGRRAVAWLESDVQSWIQSRLDAQALLGNQAPTRGSATPLPGSPKHD